MITKLCASCNGLLEESSDPGRFYHWKGEPIPLPDDFVFATCYDCDADWLYQAHYERLDRLIGERQAFEGRAQMAALPLAMALMWALHVQFIKAAQGRGYEHNRFTSVMQAEMYDLFGGSLERGDSK